MLDTLRPRPYVDVQRILDPLVPAGRRYAGRGVHLQALTDDSIDVLIDHANTAPSPACEVVVIPGGGALERIAPETSPLAHRDTPATIWLLAAWDDPADTERNIAWADAGAIALDPLTAGICLNLTGHEPAERIATAFDNESYRQLQAIKHADDPANVLRSNHNVPPRSLRPRMALQSW